MRRTLISTILLSLLLLVSTVSPFILEVSIGDENIGNNTSGRACGGPSETASITILPPGPVTLPADQSRTFVATLKNSNGDTLGGSPDWSVSDGSINPQGGAEAIYYPTSIGTHTVSACAGDITESVEVVVTMGTTQSIELTGNKINLTADEIVELTVTEFDLHSNSGTMFVPSSEWIIPEGSSLNVQPGQPAIWTPGPVGNQTISVTASGFTSSWQVNVSRGMGDELVINVDRTIITSDETLELSMAVSDIRGNLIDVSGNWSMLAPQATSWLSGNGSHSTFSGNLVGNWTLRGEYNGSENGNINMWKEITIDVRVGKISLVQIEGHDSNLLTGDILEMNPVATDLDGNIISDATFNWSVEGPSGIESIDLINHTFTPSTEGQHNIMADSGGRPSSIRVQVSWSEPIDLNVTTSDGDWYLTVTTGGDLPLHVEGLDMMGDWHPFNPTWQIDEDFGAIEESGGTGDYIYHSAGVNWTQLHAFTDSDEYTILVYVTPGMLDHLEVTISDSGVQGKSVLFTVRGFDISGNGIAIPLCDITLTSSAGRTECDSELGWRLFLDNDGEQHILTATYEGSEGTGFIDIQPTLLGGQFGSSTQVIAGGAVLIALLISVVLIVVYLRVKRLAKEEEDYENEEDVATNPVVAPMVQMQPPPPPMLGMPPTPSGFMPPPPAMLGNQPGKAPLMPPPAFMFGTGIAANSSSSAPMPGVFVRSKEEYGWGDSKGQNTEGYGWEQQPATNVATAPPPQPSTSDALNTLGPAVSQEEEKTEDSSSLGSALSLFSTPNEETNVAESTQTDVTESTENEPEPVEQVVIEEEEALEQEETEQVENESADVESVEVESEEENENTATDEWGAWDSEWDADAKPTVQPGLGPRTEQGDILNPLPGTKSGESGWYFDTDGKPSLWEFRHVGWERIK
jgi:hypothetical protein